MRTTILGTLVLFALVGMGWTADGPRVFVVGAVNRPGVLHYEQGLTVESVINRVGGVPHLSMTNQATSDKDYVYVIGWVQREGQYEFQPDMTVGRAIALAGGLRLRKGHLLIGIVRVVNGTKITVEVDLDDRVHPRDVINVTYEKESRSSF